MTLVKLLSLLITADNRMTTLSHLNINTDATELANARALDHPLFQYNLRLLLNGSL